MDFRERLYLSPARAVIRRLQGVRLYSKLRARTSGGPQAVKQSFSGDATSVSVECVGVQAELLADDETEFRRALAYGEEAPFLGAILSHLGSGDSYWDIGASVGLYTVIAAARVGPTGQVVAFEPERSSFKRLTSNVCHNGFDDRVILCANALGAERTELVLTVAGHHASGAHSFVGVHDGGGAPDEQVIAVVPGDDFSDEHELRIPTVMKIDVEGAELDVVKGLLRTLDAPELRAVFVEVHFATLDAAGRGRDPKTLISTMNAYGFGRRWIDKSHVLFER